MRIASSLLIFALLVSCNHPSDTFVPDSELQGAWILFEQGYSPGNGYVVNPVSEDPPRTIVFSGENQFNSTLQNLLEYRFFRVDKNTSGSWELWLFQSEPDPSKDPEATRLMYDVEFENGKLKLSPAFPSRCIEGCHLGFKR